MSAARRLLYNQLWQRCDLWRFGVAPHGPSTCRWHALHTPSDITARKKKDKRPGNRWSEGEMASLAGDHPRRNTCCSWKSERVCTLDNMQQSSWFKVDLKERNRSKRDSFLREIRGVERFIRREEMYDPCVVAGLVFLERPSMSGAKCHTEDGAVGMFPESPMVWLLVVLCDVGVMLI